MKLNTNPLKGKYPITVRIAGLCGIFSLVLIFFMVTTVLREYSGLPVNIPKAEKIEKLKGKRHTAHIWVSKEGLVSINDRLFAVQDVAKIMYEKRVSDPQLIVSLTADEEAKMELISSIHEELREAAALKVNYSTKTLVR